MVRERYLHRLNTSALDNRHIGMLEEGFPALLILNMQDYFLSSSSPAFVPSAPDLIPVLVRLAEAFQCRDLPVVYTKHVNTSENAGMMAVRWKELIAAENPLSRINSAFDTSWDAVLDKPQYDAFHNTELEKLLKQMEVTSLVVTGVLTDVCCATTARSAFTRGYRTIMPVDSTAAMNMELHRAAVTAMSYGFFRPVSARAVEKTILSVY
ncbi:hypothetical protein CSA37_09420 [Candidatus Fermentibacteria bacterium]|nr:MAG: hypothetical protein CSA37_09420 [Candidatus Fermentibacteria bacterium]